MGNTTTIGTFGTLSDIWQKQEATVQTVALTGNGATETGTCLDKNSISARTRWDWKALLTEAIEKTKRWMNIALFSTASLATTSSCTNQPLTAPVADAKGRSEPTTLPVTAVVAPVSQSPAQSDNLGLPANVIADFNKTANTADKPIVVASTDPAFVPQTSTTESFAPSTEQELEAYLLTRNYSPDERKEIIATMNGLTERNYSPAERKEILTLLERSRDFTREYKLDTPLSRVYFSPKDNTPSERLAAVNANLAKLASIPSKTISEAIGADQVTPQNMPQVITFVHTANDAERDAIYGTDHAQGGDWDKKGGAWTRVIAGQGVKWQANLPKLSEESMQKACDLANMFLAHQVHRSVEWSRLVVTSALDFVYTPKISETVTEADQKANLKNRSLNLAQELAWMTAMTSADMPWGTKPEEIAKITVGQFTYSFASQERIAQIPGLSDDKKAITPIAYEMLQNAQTEYVVAQQKHEQAQVEIKQTEAEIEQIRAHSKETEAHSKAWQQSIDLMKIGDPLRKKIISLLGEFLTAPVEKDSHNPLQKTQWEIREQVRLLTVELLQAKVKIEQVQTTDEENEEIKRVSIEEIELLYPMIKKVGIDIATIKKELGVS